MHGHFDIKNLNEDTVVDSLGGGTTGNGLCTHADG
jgi:hypothetical protein